MAAGAIAFVALLVLPERRNWLPLCLLIAAALAAVEATHDRPQWFAPTGYVVGAAATAMGRERLWWGRYSSPRRYGLAFFMVFAVGSAYATRVALESNWELDVSLTVVAMGLFVVALVAVALWLAWRRANAWPLLIVTILLTPCAIFLMFSAIGVVFLPPLIALWVATVRAFRRVVAPSSTTVSAARK